MLGWLLITVSLPRLPAALTSVTLTVQPVASVVLGVILLGEDPSALQLAGTACILGGLILVALGRQKDRAVEQAKLRRPPDVPREART